MIVSSHHSFHLGVGAACVWGMTTLLTPAYLELGFNISNRVRDPGQVSYNDKGNQLFVVIPGQHCIDQWMDTMRYNPTHTIVSSSSYLRPTICKDNLPAHSGDGEHQMSAVGVHGDEVVDLRDWPWHVTPSDKSPLVPVEQVPGDGRLPRTRIG